MKLLNIHLNYFRQHRDTAISFADGITGIFGPNGAGKSTLLEAVCFALFGSRAIRGRVDDLTTRGFKPRQTNVVLNFEHNLQVFQLSRTIDDASLCVANANTALASGTRAVTEKLTQILGMTLEEFTNTYFTEQKGLEFLSGLKGATERSRFIVRMLGYDKLERAQELLRKDRAENRTKLMTLQSSLKDPEQIVKQIQDEQVHINELKASLVKSELALKAAETESAKQNAQKQSLAKKLSDYDDITALIQKNEGQQVLLSEQIKQIEKNTNSKLHELEMFKQQSNYAIDLTLEQRTEISSALNIIEQDLNQEQITWHRQQSELRAEINLLDQQLRQLAQKTDNLSVLQDTGTCPTCGQSLGAAFNKVASDLEKEKSCIEQSLITKNNSLDKLLIKPDGIDALERKRSELTAKLEALDLQHKILIKISDYDKEIERLKVDLAAKNAQIFNLKNTILDLQQKLGQLDFDPKVYKSKVDQCQATDQLLNVARLQRQKAEAELDKFSALLARSQQELMALKQQHALVAKAQAEVLLLDEGDRVLTDLRNNLNASVRPRLAELASEFILDLTDGRYSAIEIGEDFTATVIEDGLAKPVISGGEQDILNLCVRLALSHMLAERAGSEVNLLVLDEVFGSLDEQRRANVLILLEKLKSRFEQILIISHLDDIKDGVEHFISIDFDEGSLSVNTEQFSGNAEFSELVGNI